MTAPSTCIAAASSRLPAFSPRLSRRAAFYLQASITMSFLAGSSAPTPLYPLYQAAWGFSSITVTFVFGIYALAVLGALLVVGRLSDHIGRRPVLFVSTLAQALAMLVLGSADGVGGLIAGRVIQGLAAGAAVAAVGAGLIDLDKARGTIANSIAPIMGTALGALIGGLMVHFLPSPTHLVYEVLGGMFIVQAIGVVLMPEVNAPRPGALASLRPQFALPAAVRSAMWLAVPVMVAVWALAGFYASLGPALLHRVFGFDASLFGGLALFTMAASGALAVLAMQRFEARTLLASGAVALFVGVAIAQGGLAVGSAALFFIGSSISGMGFGVGFQGAVRSVVPLAAAHQRAGVLSVAFVVSYLAMGLPAIVAGALVAGGESLLGTAHGFGLVVMALAAVAWIGTLSRRGTIAAT